jgi:hypothetical protein
MFGDISICDISDASSFLNRLLEINHKEFIADRRRRLHITCEETARPVVCGNVIENVPALRLTYFFTFYESGKKNLWRHDEILFFTKFGTLLPDGSCLYRVHDNPNIFWVLKGDKLTEYDLVSMRHYLFGDRKYPELHFAFNYYKQKG